MATGFHLWWHPHDFGLETAANLAALDRRARIGLRAGIAGTYAWFLNQDSAQLRNA